MQAARFVTLARIRTNLKKGSTVEWRMEMTAINRFIAIGAAMAVGLIVYLWLFARIESHALALIGAALAVLPVIMLLRCQLDPCQN